MKLFSSPRIEVSGVGNRMKRIIPVQNMPLYCDKLLRVKLFIREKIASTEAEAVLCIPIQIYGNVGSFGQG